MKNLQNVDGQYTIRVALAALLPSGDVRALVEALQRSYDDGTAGLFDIASAGGVSVVTFYREISADLEVVETNLSRGGLLPGDVESVLVAQLADELSVHQDESPYVREIVASMRVPGVASAMVGGIDSFRDSLSNAFKAASETPSKAFYVIRSRSEGQGDIDGDLGAFWSNEDGWGHLQTATRFDTKERVSGNLPMTAGMDAEWMLEEDAQDLLRAQERANTDRPKA